MIIKRSCFIVFIDIVYTDPPDYSGNFLSTRKCPTANFDRACAAKLFLAALRILSSPIRSAPPQKTSCDLKYLPLEELNLPGE